MTLMMTSSTVSDIGLVRKNNQDSSFAGTRLVSVCDGMGGHAGGDTASTIAIRSLAHIENHRLNENKAKAVDEAAAMLTTSVTAAHDAIVGKADREKQLAGMGTTVEAVVLVNGYWIVAHIGDSRAYLLRNGDIIRATKDHSYVQHLIDTGRITPQEAHSHPQRNVVMRVLGDFDIDPRPDISIRKAQPGDRWLLCSDGLFGVLSDETICATLASHPHLQECAQTLVSMALKAGSTDNVTVAIADAYDDENNNAHVSLSHASSKMCLVAGAASSDPQPLANSLNLMVAVAPALQHKGTVSSPAARAAQLTEKAYENAGNDDSDNSSSDFAQPVLSTHDDSSKALNQTSADSGKTEAEIFDEMYEIQRIVRPHRSNTDATDDAVEVAETDEIPIILKTDGSLSDDPHDPDVAHALRIKREEEKKQARKRRSRAIAIQVAITTFALTILSLVGWRAWAWSQTQYYVKDSDGVVAIYQGVNTRLLNWDLGHKIEDTHTKMDALPQGWQERLRDGISVKSYGEARTYVQQLEKQAHTSDDDDKSSSQNGDVK